MDFKQTQSVRVKAIDKEGEGTGTLVFATLNVIDKDGDVTLPGAFGEQVVKVIPAHDWGHVIIGKAKTYERGDEALVDFRLNLEIQAAKDWHSALKFDLEHDQPVQEWSYGFSVLEQSFGEHDGQRVQFLKKLKVHEVSPVIVGAGVNTRTLDVKSAKGMRLAEHFATVRDGAKDFVQRVKELKQLRAADGRVLSEEKRKELNELKAALDEMHQLKDALTELLEDPQAYDQELGRQLYSEFLKSTLRVRGLSNGDGR